MFFVIAGLLLVGAHCRDISMYQLHHSADDKKLIFQYLDVDSDGKLNKKEVDRLFQYRDNAAAASAKFFTFIEGHEATKDVTQEELSKFLDDKAFTYASYKCKYVFSMSLRKKCLEDQIRAFVHLVLPIDVINTFFTKFDQDKDKKIGMVEIKPLFTEGDENQKTDNANNFLQEIGGPDKVITESEFVSYVMQEDLFDDFRPCLGKDQQYDHECLKKGLIRYTKDSFTEMNVAVIYGTLDADADGMIEASDLIGPDLCNEPCDPENLLTLMDTEDKDSLITFEEFRTYITGNNIISRVERKCNAKYPATSKKLACFLQEVFKVITDYHKPVWLTLPQEDMIVLFEKMDADNDGRVEVLDDLKTLGCSAEVGKKLENELDGVLNCKSLGLKEFQEFVGEPSIIYSLSDCRDAEKGKVRTECYTKKITAYIENMTPNDKVVAFFRFYDKAGKDRFSSDDLSALIKESDDVDEFCDEVGMGDNIINLAEFRWYVRQEEISTMIKAEKCEDHPDKLHEVLLKYMHTKLTELNMQSLFDIADTNGSWDLEAVDWLKWAVSNGKTENDVTSLISKMDLPPETDGIVNFEEFRLFLLRQKRKETLETKCIGLVAKPSAKTDVNCFMKEIWSL